MAIGTASTKTYVPMLPKFEYNTPNKGKVVEEKLNTVMAEEYLIDEASRYIIDYLKKCRYGFEDNTNPLTVGTCNRILDKVSKALEDETRIIPRGGIIAMSDIKDIDFITPTPTKGEPKSIMVHNLATKISDHLRHYSHEGSDGNPCPLTIDEMLEVLKQTEYLLLLNYHITQKTSSPLSTQENIDRIKNKTIISIPIPVGPLVVT